MYLHKYLCMNVRMFVGIWYVLCMYNFARVCI